MADEELQSQLPSLAAPPAKWCTCTPHLAPNPTPQVSRKRLPSDWHKRAAAIQAKITEAAKELPPGLLASLPGGADAPIDYFRAAAVRDRLAEGGERTLFGGLAGAAGLWDNIVKAYEKQSEGWGAARVGRGGAARPSQPSG